MTALLALCGSARELLDAGESPSWTVGIIGYALEERMAHNLSRRDLALILASAAAFIAEHRGVHRELREP